MLDRFLFFFFNAIPLHILGIPFVVSSLFSFFFLSSSLIVHVWTMNGFLELHISRKYEIYTLIHLRIFKEVS